MPRSFQIWSFQTRNFTVLVTATPDWDYRYDGDDPDGAIQRQLDDGDLTAYDIETKVLFAGAPIGVNYLGGCVYADIADFRDHVGLALKSRADNVRYGSYFVDGVKEAIREARTFLARIPKVRTP